MAKVATMHADLVGSHTVGFPPTAHFVPDAGSMFTRVYLAAPEGGVLARAGLEHLLEHPGHCYRPLDWIPHKDSMQPFLPLSLGQRVGES